MGWSSVQLAAELGTTQRTINRWKSSATFQAEVRRLHELMAIQGAGVSGDVDGVRASHKRRARAPWPRGDAMPTERWAARQQEHVEVEAMIAEILDRPG